jgi:hypothetical protein
VGARTTLISINYFVSGIPKILIGAGLPALMNRTGSKSPRSKYAPLLEQTVNRAWSAHLPRTSGADVQPGPCGTGGIGLKQPQTKATIATAPMIRIPLNVVEPLSRKLQVVDNLGTITRQVLSLHSSEELASSSRRGPDFFLHNSARSRRLGASAPMKTSTTERPPNRISEGGSCEDQ